MAFFQCAGYKLRRAACTRAQLASGRNALYTYSQSRGALVFVRLKNLQFLCTHVRHCAHSLDRHKWSFPVFILSQKLGSCFTTVESFF